MNANKRVVKKNGREFFAREYAQDSRRKLTEGVNPEEDPVSLKYLVPRSAY